MVRIIMITASAAAKGQLFPRVIWSWIRLPTSTILFPPRISAIKNKPIDGIKVRITPERSPGKVSLKVTLQKAFHLLEEEQLIESRTGAKSCMTLPEKTLAALRQELLSEELRNAARTLRQMGITKEDALRLLAQAWEEEET